MYFSFINDELEKLRAQIDKLEEFTSAAEISADDILEDLRQEMRDKLHEAITVLLEEHDLQDNYFDEKRQEIEEEMQQYIEQSF